MLLLINHCNFLMQGGDLGSKRAKVDKESAVNDEAGPVGRSTNGLEQPMASTSLERAASTSNATTKAKTESSGYDQLPKEMNSMKIRDDKTVSVNSDDKVVG